MAIARYSAEANAPADLLWQVLLEKVEDPGRHAPGVESCEVLERSGDSLVRRLVTLAGEVRERVTVDRAARRVVSETLEHPHYTGTFTKQVLVAGSARPVLSYALDWVARPGAGLDQDQDLTPAVMKGVLHTIQIAESRARAEDP